MKNFNFDGEYRGYQDGSWEIDEKDGHLWITLPNIVALAGFSKAYTLKFMETPKERNTSRISLTDEVFNVPNFEFDTLLKTYKPEPGKRDYYGYVIGRVLDIQVPDSVPPGVTIGSIVIWSEELQVPVAVINLRSILSLDLMSKLKFNFGAEIRTASYGERTFNDIAVDDDIECSVSVFFIPVPTTIDPHRVLVSSPEDYKRYQDGPNQNFDNYHTMDHYTEASLLPPPLTVTTNQDGTSILNLTGPVKMLKGFTGIKTFVLPFCPGISAVIRIDRFMEDGVVKDYLDTTKENYIDFKVDVKFLEVVR